jgi:hypothetical protein
VLCICRGRFFLFFSFRLVEIFCANIHQLSHPAEGRRTGDERRPHPIEVMRVGVCCSQGNTYGLDFDGR